jgi:hypothetical protein
MMKTTSLAAILALAAANKSVDVKKMETIVEGILMGALDAEGFTDITHCIQDVEHVVQDAQAAYTDFSKKDVQSIIAGVKEVADLMKTVKQGMSDCSSLKADWVKLEQMVEIFDSPTSFAYHVGKDLMINGVEIFHEVETAITDYESADWNGFGYNIGKAAAKTILGEESQLLIKESNKNKVGQIMQGMLKPFGGKFNLEALLMCIYDEDQAALMFDVAVQSFETAWEKKEFEDAIGGIIAVVAGVQQVKQGLPACKAIDSQAWNFQEFDTCTDIAVHPTQYFEVIEKDVLLNGTSIIADAEKAVKAYRAGKYGWFGYEMGKIIKLATEAKAMREAKEDSPSPDATMAAEVAQGFLEATNVGTFNFTNLLICIYEADQAALILDEGVKQLEEAWKDKSIQEAIPGVIMGVAFVQQLKQSLPVCEAVDTKNSDWTTFDQIVSVAESPINHMQLIENDIQFNGVSITEDLSLALDAFRSGEFKQYGYLLGKVLTLATKKNDNLFLY